MTVEIGTELKSLKNGSCFCYSCGIEIWFSDEYLTPFGKKIPLDFEQDEKGNVLFHNCIAKHKSTVPCQWCSELISFSENRLSKNGKKIPLCKDGSNVHNCSKNPYNFGKRNNDSKIIFSTSGISSGVHKTLEEKQAEFIKKEEEFRRQWR